ncbi:HNH endonuclease [Solibacillus sp. FSL K6-1781]|uniref:HNH endonuclease n=1 Tax=Solibacillus sp. FSL K6-1781 TaxID=2921474 RepID=UPI003159A3A8
MTYLLKRLGHQELGSITPQRPTPARGRYLMVTKNNEFLNSLPYLSKTVLNDYQILTIIPLYKNRFERNYCTFVYNNDKYHGGGNGGQPRDEYRIYLNRALEGDTYYFEANDILVLKPYIYTTNVGGIDESETVYFAYLEKNRSSKLYRYLDDCINNYPIRGGYGILDDEIEEVEQAINNILDPIDVNPTQNMEYFNENTAIDVSSRITSHLNNSERSIEDLFNSQAMFRNFVQVAYEGRCAVTNQVIRSGNFNNLQAAHIHPRSHNGFYTPNNGILMNRDMHWAFDVGCFTINDDYVIKVHPEVESEYLHSFNGHQIFIPKTDFFQPSLTNLEYHRANIYGTFLKRGRIM